jgi:hypothetical protein
LRFVEYWKRRTGHRPEELVFDSHLTTYETLSRLNQMGIQFMTFRRRDVKMLQEIHQQPLSAWHRIELEGVTRTYRTPRLLDQRIRLRAYDGPIRQLTVTHLSHEEPTIMLTNQLHRVAGCVVGRYAQRMLIENGIADWIDFFHTGALFSAVAMKVSCDLQLTLNAVATVVIDEREITVRFQKPAHTPLLMAADFAKIDLPVPWLDKKRLRLRFG